MKIKDVIQEGFWSSLGRGVAQGLGVTDSNVEKNAEKSLRSQADLQTRAKLPALAQQEFNKLLANSGINLVNPRTYDKDHLAQQLKAFAVHYFATGLPNAVAQHIEDQIESMSSPASLTDASVSQFLTLANDVRSNAIDNQEKLTKLQQAPAQKTNSQQPAQQQSTPAANGLAIPSPQPAPAPTTVPPAPKGYINTLDVAGRKFYLDNRGDWYEYHGQMWPKDISIAQKVTDVNQLAPYIQAGKVKQEPYGTKKKK